MSRAQERSNLKRHNTNFTLIVQLSIFPQASLIINSSSPPDEMGSAWFFPLYCSLHTYLKSLALWIVGKCKHMVCSYLLHLLLILAFVRRFLAAAFGLEDIAMPLSIFMVKTRTMILCHPSLWIARYKFC